MKCLFMKMNGIFRNVNSLIPAILYELYTIYFLPLPSISLIPFTLLLLFTSNSKNFRHKTKRFYTVAAAYIGKQLSGYSFVLALILSSFSHLFSERNILEFFYATTCFLCWKGRHSKKLSPTQYVVAIKFCLITVKWESHICDILIVLFWSDIYQVLSLFLISLCNKIT